MSDHVILLVPMDRTAGTDRTEARLQALLPDVAVVCVPGMRGNATRLLVTVPDPEPDPHAEPDPPEHNGTRLTLDATTGAVIRGGEQ